MLECAEKNSPETIDRLWIHKGKTKLDIGRGVITRKGLTSNPHQYKSTEAV